MNFTRIRPHAGGRTLELTGAMNIDDAGNFTIELAGSGEPTPPDPGPEPPADSITITPTGGDDTGMIQRKLNELPEGYALIFSGMFQIYDTLWLDGVEKTMMGDPAKQSGFRPMRDGFRGHYGALLCTTRNTTRCRITGLEFDGEDRPVEMVFFDGGTDNTIDKCYLHNISYGAGGPPFAAIHSQATINLRVLNNRIEKTTGVNGGNGVRGIWVPGTSGTVIAGNTVRDTGHTGIALEGEIGTVTGNIVERSMVQGTGYKICYRGSGLYKRRAAPKAPGMIFRDNLVRGTAGAGLMLENCMGVGVLVEKNQFTECGSTGTFGALYSSSSANGFAIRQNRMEKCRSVGGFQNLDGALFESNTILDGNNVIYLEKNCHNITVSNSGTVNLGSNCDKITVDGKVIA